MPTHVPIVMPLSSFPADLTNLGKRPTYVNAQPVLQGVRQLRHHFIILDYSHTIRCLRVACCTV